MTVESLDTGSRGVSKSRNLSQDPLIFQDQRCDTTTADEARSVNTGGGYDAAQVKNQGCSWEEIYAALPHRSKGTIQVHYSTKLKK
jgi:hypothetical protein